MDSKPARPKHRLVGLGLALALAVVSGSVAATATEDAGGPEASAATELEPDSGVFLLPMRPGPAPMVTEGIPHIQLDQTSSLEMFEALSAWSFSLPSVVELPSAASLPGARALTLSDELEANPDAMITGREFAHIHADPGAGSLHLRLPVDEASAVIDAGWGVWHPFHDNGTMPGLVMVFAPRDEADLEPIQLIIEASVAWAGG